MTEYEYIEKRLRDEMYSGNMHRCLRDVGRIAGGHLAAGRLNQQECDALGDLAVSMAINKSEATRKWGEATAFGAKQPLQKTEMSYVAQDGGHAVGWDEVVNPADFKVVDDKWLQREELVEPDAWHPCRELSEYLHLLFEPSDTIIFCTDPWQKDGKWLPNKGTTKTVDEVLKSLAKDTQDGFDEAVGTLNNDESGAWIRINPFDGEGCKDTNVTEYKHALIECDERPIEDQVAIYKQLELPCACIISSGGKSAHAIVRVNASSLDEYKKRVNFMYDVLKTNGLKCDTQNRNPSRYSRMPGVLRNGKKQYIISRSCGKPSYEEWEEWIKEVNDDLPDFEPLTLEDIENPPPLKPELIEGILRVNHKMIVVGPSKAGKSFLLIELAIAIAEGITWLGRKCRQGRVLYINLELDTCSCKRRLSDVYKAIGVKPVHFKDVVVWNLRGRAKPLDELAPSIIRRACKFGFSAIIIDPIYKVLTGDENNAADMSEFTRSYDRIARDCACSLIFCHHHSKGGQGDKRSMDRASGSGVFARDPDAIIDLLPLESKEARDNFMQSYECAAIIKAADEQDFTHEWRKKVPQDALIVPNKLMGCLEQMFDEVQIDCVREARAKVLQSFDSVTGWRMSFVLREFASPSPINMWFKWPIHVMDDEDNLKDATPEGESSAKPKWAKKRGRAQERIDKLSAFKSIIEADPNANWTIAKVQEQFGIGERTVYRYLKQLGWCQNRGLITVPNGGHDDDSPF